MLEAIEALRAGTVGVLPQYASHAARLLELPLGPTGLPNIDGLPAETLSFARSTAMSLAASERFAPAREAPAVEVSEPC